MHSSRVGLISLTIVAKSFNPSKVLAAVLASKSTTAVSTYPTILTASLMQLVKSDEIAPPNPTTIPSKI